jgi:monothiol glutaredoxin
MADARAQIEKLINDNPVVVFMKGTPQFPQCGFSGRVVQILEHVGAPFIGVNVLEDADLRQGVKDFANWPTIPQIYVKGEFVGGADIAMEMFQRYTGRFIELTTLTDRSGQSSPAHPAAGSRS